jgi:hypothetical protein
MAPLRLADGRPALFAGYQVAEGYRAMDERRAVKALRWP